MVLKISRPQVGGTDGRTDRRKDARPAFLSRTQTPFAEENKSELYLNNKDLLLGRYFIKHILFKSGCSRKSMIFLRNCFEKCYKILCDCSSYIHEMIFVIKRKTFTTKAIQFLRTIMQFVCKLTQIHVTNFFRLDQLTCDVCGNPINSEKERCRLCSVF